MWGSGFARVLSKMLGSGESFSGGLIATHAYTVTSVERPEDGPAFIHVRNPWGVMSRQSKVNEKGEMVSKIAVSKGTSRLEFGEFLRNFKDIQVC